MLSLLCLPVPLAGGLLLGGITGIFFIGPLQNPSSREKALQALHGVAPGRGEGVLISPSGFLLCPGSDGVRRVAFFLKF